MKFPFRQKCGTAFCAAVLWGALGNGAAAASPNVVIVNLDDIGTAWLPPYARRLKEADVEEVICQMYAKAQGATKDFDLSKHLEAARTSMPVLDHLASRGAVFDWCFSTAPICAPSRAGLLTGKYQQRWGGYSIPDIMKVGIPTAVPCLAEPFKAAGYVCGIVGKWHVGIHDIAIWERAERLVASRPQPSGNPHKAVAAEASRLGFDTSCAPGQHPLDKGFDYYFGYNRHSSQYYEADDLWENRERVPQRPPGEFLTDLFNAKAAAFADQALAAGRPFLLYYAPMALHARLVPPPAGYTSRFHTGIAFSDQYAGHLAAVDEGIRKIYAVLERHHQELNTLFILTADNGQSLEKVPPYSAPFRGGKGSGWLGGSHEPLIVYWPGQIQPGVRGELVSELDIFPTALAAAGLAPPHPVDGKSLLPLLRGETAQGPHPWVFSASLQAASWSYPYFATGPGRPLDEATCPLYTWALDRHSILMYITPTRAGEYAAFPAGRPAQSLFFDLDKDVAETNNRFSANDAVKPARQALAQWLKITAPPAAIHDADYRELLRIGASAPPVAVRDELRPTPDELADLDVN